jgi:hypothetical protein
MSSAQEQKDIETRFAQNFTSVPVKYPNQNYNPDANTTWCELIIKNTASVRASIGVDSPLHRGYGLIIANMHVPKGQGAIPARELADLAAGIFRDVKFSGITCRSPNVFDAGEIEGWYVVSMNVAFFRDEIH